MSVLDELQATVATQRAVLSALEPGCLSGPDALAAAWRSSPRSSGCGAAGRTLVAKRVEESNVWRASGERSAAHFIANKTGTTVGRTQASLETAERLERAARHRRGVPRREALRAPGRGGGRRRGA